MTETDTSRKAVERIFNQNYPRGYDNLREAEVIARALLARAEKAEAERDAAWNEAIEAAATYHDHFLMVKTGIDIEQVISSTEAIRALKKGEPT